MHKILLIAFLVTFSFTAFSQPNQADKILVRAQVIDNDTIIIIALPQLDISGKMPRKVKIKIRKYNKLVRNVKKVYPYAKIAGVKFKEYEFVLTNTESEIEKKQLMKKAEQELKDEFGEDLKKLTFSQGIILIKLIDRETGNTSFEVIQELRGKFLAFFWQTFARIFGYNLKIKYDPYGKDKDIEDIVLKIEKGDM